MLSSAMIPYNAFKDVYKPVKEPAIIFRLSPKQRDTIITLGEKDPDLMPPALCLATGISPKEFICLKKSDFHAETKSLSVSSEESASRCSRTIPLTETALKLLDAASCISDSPNEPLFITGSGKRFRAEFIHAAIKKIRDYTGVHDLSYHNLMLDFIISSLQAGVDPIRLKDYLGLKHGRIILSYWEMLANQV